jgi:cytochrome b6-f complex iron-sulfur subunit
MRAEEVPYGCLVRGPGQSLLGRDERGLYALSSLCGHAGCDLLSVGMVSETGIICRCHGSRYRLDGTRLAGPTQRDLYHLKLTLRDDRTVAVDASTIVDATERTPDV